VQDFLYAHLPCAICAVSEHDERMEDDTYVRAYDGDDDNE
jgi:hypothetical protein